MKILGCIGILAMAVSMTACSSSNDNVTDNGTNTGNGTGTTSYVWTTDGGLKACDHILFSKGKEDANGIEIGNGDQEFVFTGKQTLKKGTYVLNGWVYIGNGAQLTIEPGTIIKGDKDSKAALIVERGGKLIAKGTADAPIIFTSEQAKGSRKPGDWGGIILCGKAKNNQNEMQIEGGPRTKHGGNDDTDNSGILSYVRIEFAGYPFQKDKEINGLTFGSVGSGTQIDHIQVSYSNDDSYEWFGGKVNCKYLIAYKGWDDDFDTDNGFSGNVQFGLAIRDSKIADTSQSNGFESDNCADGSPVSPYTTATFSNITFVGPKLDNNFVNTPDYITGGSYYPNNGSALGKFQAAMHIRRNSRLNCVNSIAIGWPIGLILDNQKGDTQGAATAGNMKLQNIYFAGMDAVGTDANKIYDDVLVTGYDADSKPIMDSSKKSFSSTFFLAQNGNKYFDKWTDLLLNNSYIPQAGSPVLSGASFTGIGSWFTQVSYLGALNAGDTWTSGWTNFDPQNTDY
ncbi:hypothetical protein [Prevotella sp.]|uniref:hypothetical protein n=1 Tax=Prevotella sp. TaxID=59823 RepID=UPI002647E32E|nr:hypothetical protein [Prevotella sp.]MDN5552481.1 hypothetical protein [Prevotella sp.]